MELPCNYGQVDLRPLKVARQIAAGWPDQMPGAEFLTCAWNWAPFRAPSVQFVSNTSVRKSMHQADARTAGPRKAPEWFSENILDLPAAEGHRAHFARKVHEGNGGRRAGSACEAQEEGAQEPSN